jgi:formamidopyrimidine-DNA glycosylase
MPELPEVETIRRDIEPLVTGRTITGVDVDPATLPLLWGGPLEALRTALVERTIEGVGRRGKYLLFQLDGGTVWVAHLRVTGRLLWLPRRHEPVRFERADVHLDDGHDLRWADSRKFGTWRIVPDAHSIISSLGPEPIDPDFTAAQLGAMLAGRTAPVKSFLLDQRRVAGLGNIYVDEALYQSGIHPLTPAGKLDEAQAERLWAAARDVLERGIANRGASFRDYVDAQGRAGQQHMHVQVFRRTGKPCYACGTPVERIVVGGRATHFCPVCQPPTG